MHKCRREIHSLGGSEVASAERGRAGRGRGGGGPTVVSRFTTSIDCSDMSMLTSTEKYLDGEAESSEGRDKRGVSGCGRGVGQGGKADALGDLGGGHHLQQHLDGNVWVVLHKLGQLLRREAKVVDLQAWSGRDS